MTPTVSVIVPVRDNAAGVGELIDRLAAQTLPQERFEIVIGNDGSGVGELGGIQAGDGRVRLIHGPRRTSYAARNRAAVAARGRVLAFCDSDCAPDPMWLEAGLAALSGADVVAGEITFAAPPRPTPWSLLTADMYLQQEHNVLLSRGVTANLFVGRETFFGVGGFDESLPSGGDFDFVRRSVAAGRRLAYAPAAVVRHPTIDDRRAFLRKVRRVNRTASARRVRDGQRYWPDALMDFIPFYSVMRARRHALRPALRLQHARLEAAGMRPSRSDELRALARLHLVVGYVAALARTRGWRDGRRLARAGEGRRLAGPVAARDEAGSPRTADVVA